MTIADEELMAYADEELSGEERARVAAAVAADPALAQRVAEHAALRARMHAAFAPVLDEAPPAHLLDMLREPDTARADPPDEIATARSRRAVAVAAQSSPPVRPWQRWGAMAAAVLLGLALGRGTLLIDTQEPVRSRDGVLVAAAALDQALSTQLASEQTPDASVHLGPSLVDAAGIHCRTFVMPAAQTAGLACRHAGEWRLDVLKQLDPGASAQDYRQAGSALPPLLLQAVEARTGAQMLDAEDERAARDRGWH